MPKIPTVAWAVTITTVCILIVGAAVVHTAFKGQAPLPADTSQSSTISGSILPVVSAPNSLQPSARTGSSGINPQASAPLGPGYGATSTNLQSAPAPSGSSNVDPSTSTMPSINH